MRRSPSMRSVTFGGGGLDYDGPKHQWSVYWGGTFGLNAKEIFLPYVKYSHVPGTKPVLVLSWLGFGAHWVGPAR